MTNTLEVRWFGSPPLPEALRTWFENLGPVETSAQTDLYLPVDDPGCNLKVRDEQFQIKRRLAGPVRTSLGSQASGQCEQWVKWSFPLREVPGVWTDDPTDLWVRVEKTRRQISIPSEEQSVLTDALPTTPPAGIEMELTTFNTADATAWTLCLETVGPTESLRDTFMAAAPVLMDDRLPMPLPDDQSFGYVRWFQQLPSVSTRPAPNLQLSD